jgi:hypothetical protein
MQGQCGLKIVPLFREGMAKRYLETGDSERYEANKRNALTALEAIDYFKHRLPPDLRMEIETRRFELAARISAL